MSYGLLVRDGGNVQRTISDVAVRDGGNVLRDLSEIRVRDSNNTLRLVWSLAPPMAASASPETVYGSTLGTGTATTNSTTVTPSGGTPPYTYAWTLLSRDNLSADPTANSPTAATTTFTQTSIGIGESYSATWRCTVTDDDANTATADVSSFWTDTT